MSPQQDLTDRQVLWSNIVFVLMTFSMLATCCAVAVGTGSSGLVGLGFGILIGRR